MSAGQLLRDRGMRIPAAPRWTDRHFCTTFPIIPHHRRPDMPGYRATTTCLLFLLASCGGADAPETPESPAEDQAIEVEAPMEAATAVPEGDDALATARQTADGLGRELMGLMLAKLRDEGPGGAIAFCADSAQARTAAMASEGIIIRRVTMQPRNLANAPDAYEEALLLALAQRHAAGTLPPDTAAYVGTGADHELRYMRPIRIQQQCLTCHGDPGGFPTEVRRTLAERYPDDRATGYAEGDFRGAISVRIIAPLP
jgi:hypothetical protein